MGVGDRECALKLVQKLIGKMGTSYGVCARTARNRAVKPPRASAERENEREARKYNNGTWRRNRREPEV
jgi:hypothetical protein